MKPALFLRFLLLWSLAFLWVTPLWAINRTWIPGGTFWSNPDNWKPRGVPQNGDDLFMVATSVVLDPDDMINDITNLTVHSLIFHVTSGGANFTVDWGLSGETLGVTGTLGVEDSDTVALQAFIDCGVQLEGDAEFRVQNSFNGRLYVEGPVDLNGHNLEIIPIGFAADSASVELRGIVSGNGNITISGDNRGFMGFNGPNGNTFHGTVTVKSMPAAHLNLHKQSGVAVPEDLVVGTESGVTLLASDQIGSGSFVDLRNGATLNLNGFNQSLAGLQLTHTPGNTNPILIGPSGRLTIAQRISVDNDGPLATISCPLDFSDLALIEIGHNSASSLEIRAHISDKGFRKSGPGTLRLTGTNTFVGEVDANEGSIEVFNPQSLGQNGSGVSVHLNGGNILLQSVSGLLQSLFVDSSSSLLTAIGPCSWNGPITLNSTLQAVALDPTFSGVVFGLSGRISGVGGIELLSPLLGVGNVRLGGSATNSFSGPLSVRCQQLELNKPLGVRAYAGPLVVGRPGAIEPSEVRWLNAYQNAGATLTLYSNAVVNLNGFNEDFGPVTFNGGRVETGNGQFAIYQPLTVNPSDATAVINGLLGLPPGGPARFNIGDGPAEPDLLVNASVFGNAPQLIKQGPGTMNFSGVNSYTGQTVVNEGILEAGNISTLGNVAAGTIVSNNATLRLGTIDGMTESIQLNGTGVGGTHGALEVASGGTLAGPVSLASPSTINVNPGAALVINSVISGNGPLTKMGLGNLFLGGSSANTYSGDTIISAGTLSLNKTAAKLAVPGHLSIGPASAASPAIARLLQTGNLGINSGITVNANSVLDLNGKIQTLAGLILNDGGSAQTGAGQLNFLGGSVVQVGSLSAFGSHASASITGSIGLPPNDFVTFNVAPYAPSFPFATGPEMDVPALIHVNGTENVNFVPAGISKAGVGRMRLVANNSYKGDTFADAGILQVDGAQGQSVVRVNGGARVQGNGTVGHIFLSGNSVTAPGNSPGILTCSNFNASSVGGILDVELNGPVPGIDYDQLNARGTINLAGITLRTSLGFPSAVGDQFVIISNRGPAAVTGTFTSLPQNASLYIGGEQFTINYSGGASSRNVILTRIPTPPAPVLAIEAVPPDSVRLSWPTNATGFGLETNLDMSTANWGPAGPPPIIAGTNNVVTNAASDNQRFYRLHRP
jgi:autotransporter-associated beta strand protein